jgi:hypothetical protein
LLQQQNVKRKDAKLNFFKSKDLVNFISNSFFCTHLNFKIPALVFQSFMQSYEKKKNAIYDFLI